MKLHRIYGVFLRYFYFFRRSFDRMNDVFYWPAIDLLMWGLTSSYFRASLGPNDKILTLIVSGIILWIMTWRGQYEITVGLLDDLWNKNLINLFAAPLKFSEWLVTVIIIGVIKGIISLTFASLLAYIFYRVNFFAYGFSMLPFIGLLIVSGWWVGFIVAGIILRYGTRVQALAWSAVWLISPFSVIYYPLSILPVWAQKIAAFVPTSYLFEGARQVINTGVLDWNKVLISLGLNLIYLLLALIFVRKSFAKVLQKGLVKVY